MTLKVFSNPNGSTIPQFKIFVRAVEGQENSSVRAPIAGRVGRQPGGARRVSGQRTTVTTASETSPKPNKAPDRAGENGVCQGHSPARQVTGQLVTRQPAVQKTAGAPRPERAEPPPRRDRRRAAPSARWGGPGPAGPQPPRLRAPPRPPWPCCTARCAAARPSRAGGTCTAPGTGGGCRRRWRGCRRRWRRRGRRRRRAPCGPSSRRRTSGASGACAAAAACGGTGGAAGWRCRGPRCCGTWPGPSTGGRRCASGGSSGRRRRCGSACWCRPRSASGWSGRCSGRWPRTGSGRTSASRRWRPRSGRPSSGSGRRCGRRWRSVSRILAWLRGRGRAPHRYQGGVGDSAQHQESCSFFLNRTQLPPESELRTGPDCGARAGPQRDDCEDAEQPGPSGTHTGPDLTRMEPGQALTFIGHQEAEGKGNVHTGAKPPWLTEEEDGSRREIGPSYEEFLKQREKQKLKKLPAERVGANFDHTSETGTGWLPSFGRVWNHGRRWQSRHQFRTESGEKKRR
ncbi:centrosomal AT-AC splicing factor isoform X2 [Columba livia]|uniref:centrosomal AT-AC splicing factor isoform X2 n=1 Tax=Columba livia TaxID=8932 RepID=UPI0031BA98B4